MTATVEVWNRANTTKLADLTVEDEQGRRWAPSTARIKERVLGGDLGEGDVTIPDGHPDTAQLTYRNVVRLVDGETVRGAFTVGSLDWAEVAQLPQSNRNRKAAGPGLLDRWNDMVVAPWVALDAKPLSLTRLFNAASPRLDTTSLTSTVYQQTRSGQDPDRPIAIPEPVSAWIWGRAEGDPHPAEEWVFRREFNLADAADVAFFQSADDRFRAFVDGAELLSETPEFPADVWWWTYRAGVELPAGDNLYAIIVRNDAAIGAALASAWESDGDGIVSPPLFVTGADEENPYIGEWLAGNLTAGGIGWTVGAILRVLLEEAQARGAMTDVTLGFDDEVDSANQPWEIIPEVALRVGDRGGRVLQQLEPWAEFGIDLGGDGIVTKAWNRGGRGGPSGQTLTEGVNLRHLAHHGKA